MESFLGGCGGIRILLGHVLALAFVSVELFLNRRLRIAAKWISRKLRVAGFANSQHRSISDSFHDAKVSFCHESSVPQAAELGERLGHEIYVSALPLTFSRNRRHPIIYNRRFLHDWKPNYAPLV